MFGLNVDSLVTCGLVGFARPLIQAALDKPYWTSARRRVLAWSQSRLQPSLTRNSCKPKNSKHTG